MNDSRSEQLRSLSIDRTEDSRRSGVPLAGVAVIALVFAGLGAGGGYLLFGGGNDAPEPARAAQPAVSGERPASTTGEPATSVAVPRSTGLVASGYVVARRQATVSAEISGRIREILFEEGTEVEAGQILARLDDTRARLQLDELNARVNAANARIGALTAQRAEAANVLERAQRLASTNIGSEAAVTAAQSQLSSLNAQIQSARADAAAASVQVQSQQDLIERHVVRAPFAGVVIAKNAQVGEILFPGSAGGGFTRTGVATLVDMASLEIEVDVNEGQIQRVTAGQRVEALLDAYPDWDIPAHVEAIIPTADRSRATIQVRVAFDERDDRILPDMAARVTFVE
ncbi:MAG: efflux transporter periplasmic adaptor subunit [Maricaulis sp.]|nr:efflux transporter periplasmic adaptor subunit [Maricaulis sp.]HAQ34584.1 efflux transporter periplasmic adaptor subunit [Alphaproteobacteria bacterium]